MLAREQMDSPVGLDSDYHFERPAFEDARKQIRLLEIAREDDKLAFEDPIPCKLTVHNLEDVANQFTAISYTWGPKTYPQTIRVNGQTIQVRISCWYALWQMRLHNFGRRYWIDAICIDQESHGEKEQQVQHMGFVYSQAQTVAACIGGSGSVSSLYPWSTFPNDRLPASTASSLVALSKRSYFHRLWIVQECMLAKEVIVFSGRSRKSLSSLAEAVKYRNLRDSSARAKNRLDWAVADSTSHMRGLLSFMEDYRSSQLLWAEMKLTGRRADLITYRSPVDISQYFDRECQNPCDKLYGVLSLLDPKFRRRIPIDYARGLPEVLVDYANAFPILVADPLADKVGAFARSIRLLSREFADCSYEYREQLEHLITNRLQDHRMRQVETDVGRTLWATYPALQFDIKILCQVPRSRVSPAHTGNPAHLGANKLLCLTQEMLQSPEGLEALRQTLLDDDSTEARPSRSVPRWINHRDKSYDGWIQSRLRHRLRHMLSKAESMEVNDGSLLCLGMRAGKAAFLVPSGTLPGDVLLQLNTRYFIFRIAQDDDEHLTYVGNAHCLSIFSLNVSSLPMGAGASLGSMKDIPSKLHLPPIDLLIYLLLHDEEPDIGRLIAKLRMRTARLSVSRLTQSLDATSRGVLWSQVDRLDSDIGLKGPSARKSELGELQEQHMRAAFQDVWSSSDDSW